MKFQKIIFVIALLLAVSVAANFALAADRPLEGQYPSLPGATTPTTVKTPLPDYINYIFNFSLWIGGLLVFGMMILGGFRWFSSRGSAEVINDAKDQIFSAFLGLVILLSSYIILNTINPQLVFLNLGPLVNKNTIAPPVPPQAPEDKKVVFFQVPTGKIIERAMLDDGVKKQFNDAVDEAKELEKQSKDLKDLAQQLKNLTDACKCGGSACISNNAGCTGAGSCDGATCNKAAIKLKTDEINDAIKEFKKAQENLAKTKTKIADKLLELKQAATFMALLRKGFIISEIEDYNNMLTNRNVIEKNGGSVEFDYFPGWDNIKITLNGNTVSDPATFYLKKSGREKMIDDIKNAEAESLSLYPFK